MHGICRIWIMLRCRIQDAFSVVDSTVAQIGHSTILSFIFWRPILCSPNLIIFFIQHFDYNYTQYLDICHKKEKQFSLLSFWPSILKFGWFSQNVDVIPKISILSSRHRDFYFRRRSKYRRITRNTNVISFIESLSWQSLLFPKIFFPPNFSNGRPA